jgi:hypothetical protein
LGGAEVGLVDMIPGINLKIIAGLGLTGIVAVGVAGYKGYSYGYEIAALRCESRVQVVKDEVARRNEAIRAEGVRRRQELDALLARRTDEAAGASRREADLRKRVDGYEAMLRKRGDACPLTEEDVRLLR